MYTNDSSNSKTIMSGDGRTFRARFDVLGESITEGIISVRKTQRTVPDQNMTIGGATSSYIDVRMWNPSVNLENQEIQLYIGVLVDGDPEWIPCGKYIAEKPTITNGLCEFTAYGFIKSKLSGAYTTDITLPADGRTLVAEIATKTGVSILFGGQSGINVDYITDMVESGYDDDGNVITTETKKHPFNGCSYADALGYIAMMYGCVIVEDRTGGLVSKGYGADSSVTIGTGKQYGDIKVNENLFSVGMVSCDVNGTTISAGEGSGAIALENPAMTQTALNYVLYSFNGLSYHPLTVSFLGDHRIDPCDTITIQDLDGESYDVPVMYHELYFDGGLKSYIGSYGMTEQEATITGGSITKKLEAIYLDFLKVKEIVGEKATFEELNAVVGRIDNLFANQITAQKLTLTGESSINLNNVFTVDNQGNMTASSGRIGGINITSDYLYNSKTKDGTTYQMHVRGVNDNLTYGCFQIRVADSSGNVSYPFLVRGNGELTATNAKIKGNVEATSGKFGNMTINSSGGLEVSDNSGNTIVLDPATFKVFNAQNANNKKKFELTTNTGSLSVGSISAGNIQSGKSDTLTVPANGTLNYDISFATGFTSAPHVVACLSHDNPSANSGKYLNAIVKNNTRTTTGCRVVLTNSSSSALNIYVSWIAIG